MNSFRRSETLFMILGAALIVIALILIQSDSPFMPGGAQDWTDPFAGKYAPMRATAIPLPTATPQMTPSLSTEELFKKEISKIELKTAQRTPRPTVTTTPMPTTTPRRVYEKEKIYLLKPGNQAILRRVGNSKKGYTVNFHFEVVPKETTSTLEIYFRERLIHSENPPVSPDGTYRISVTLKNPGLYQWKVKSPGFRGHLRYFTIRP